MDVINLQNKTRAKFGKAEKYWFENENIELKRTLFHRIVIPLQPFDSGLEYETQPVRTEIVIEWLDLKLTDPDDLNGLMISSEKYEGLEASIYVGHAHNICEIKKLVIRRLQGDLYQVEGDLWVDFENEGVGASEAFSIQTTIEYNRGKKEN